MQAVVLGAVDILLSSEEVIPSLAECVTNYGGKVLVFSKGSQEHARLVQLTGICALLRFPIATMDEEERSCLILKQNEKIAQENCEPHQCYSILQPSQVFEPAPNFSAISFANLFLSTTTPTTETFNNDDVTEEFESLSDIYTSDEFHPLYESGICFFAIVSGNKSMMIRGETQEGYPTTPSLKLYIEDVYGLSLSKAQTIVNECNESASCEYCGEPYIFWIIQQLTEELEDAQNNHLGI
eukprot:m.17175 g.17175  ORF g.17175 m.17175 type:complete len:240 (-) comp5925_c0_seq2:1467-2186(-)